MVQVGYTIGLIVFGLLLLIGLVWTAVGAAYREVGVFLGGASFAIAIAVVGFLTLWPFDMQYHSYVMTAGTVKSLQLRQYAEDHGTTQYYGVEFADGRIRKCGDLRCGLLKPGDDLTLWCVREYQFGPTDAGWTCDWGSSTRVKAQ